MTPHVCTVCKNDRLDETDKNCWKCGATRDKIDPPEVTEIIEEKTGAAFTFTTSDSATWSVNVSSDAFLRRQELRRKSLSRNYYDGIS